MEKKEDLLKNFKEAISSTVKSLSNTENIEVVFGNHNLKSDKLVVRLPLIEEDNKINYLKIRALADSEALKIKYSNNKILKTFEPKGLISKKLYDLAEKIRYEKIGSLKFKGVSKNINQNYINKVSQVVDTLFGGSRWMNAVAVYTTNLGVDALNELECVKHVIPMNYQGEITGQKSRGYS